LHLDQFACEWRPPTQLTVLYVGRLSPEKGIEVLLDAVALVRERMPSRWSEACREKSTRPRQTR